MSGDNLLPQIYGKTLEVKPFATVNEDSFTQLFDELRDFYDPYEPPTLWEMTKFRYKRYGIIGIITYPLDEWLERIIVPVVHNIIRTASKNYFAVQKYNFVLYEPPWWFKPACKIQNLLANYNKYLHEKSKKK